MCLACIITPAAGADVNVNTFSTTLYALVADCVFGYCVTPSSVTNKSLLDETVFDNVNVVVDPFAVNSSTVLSAISKLPTVSPINDANILSVASGAELNTIVESDSIL